jgi:hypothetical protein
MGTGLFDFGKIPAALQPTVAWYLSLVGGHNYSFFSPDIPTQTIVKCEIIYKSGDTSTVAFEESINSFTLRSTYLFQLLSDNHDYETAAKIADRYCFGIGGVNTRTVRVSIGKFIVPSIADYKAGKPYGFSELYTETFTHE